MSRATPWRETDDRLPLHGVRVLDIGVVIAGPGVASRLGDFGADVIKVEHPVTGDTTRTMGWAIDGITLWSKWINRNKRPVTLDLSKPKGREILLRLAQGADLLVESFRPGTLEKWDLSPDVLLERNPRLVIVRISGFGQTGPYSPRPGFGTLAEAISGYAHMTGFPDGPPILPPVALADEAAGLVGAFAAMVALYRRDAGAANASGSERGRGQVIDVSLFESLFQMTGPIPAVYDKLGIAPGRIGSRMAYSAPRGAYPTKDGRWIGISGSAQSAARRVLTAIGRPELADDARFATNEARVENVKQLDQLIADWTRRHTLDEAMAAFEQHEAAAAPVYDIAQIVADPHYRARRTLVRVPDEELGDLLMTDVLPRLSDTPGRIRHPGLPKGAANADVFGALGIGPDERDSLRRDGVI